MREIYPPAPRVVQVTTSRFHQFDLARQLEKRGLLEAIYTGYPRWKLRKEALPPQKVRTFPWVHASYMALGARYLPPRACAWWEYLSQVAIDRHVAADLTEVPDVVIAMSGHGRVCGRRVQQGGGAWICVRGSTHVRFQQRVLGEEFARWGIPWQAPPEAVTRREEAEYAAADRIAVPSHHVLESFVNEGVSRSRLALVPYGGDIARFYPVAAPATDGSFQVVCVGALSVRKGIGHLIEAFRRFRHPAKRLVLIGSKAPGSETLLGNLPDGVEVLGYRSQEEIRDWLSRSHVFALCSVEEGLANVLGQALACGCPVVATAATGAADLFTNEVEGFILPSTDPAAIAERFSWLAGDEPRRRRMAAAARRRLETLGGWDAYGDRMEAVIRTLSTRGWGRKENALL